MENSKSKDSGILSCGFPNPHMTEALIEQEKGFRLVQDKVER